MNSVCVYIYTCVYILPKRFFLYVHMRDYVRDLRDILCQSYLIKSTHTHTHTHIYIYIYIYNDYCVIIKPLVTAG